MLCLRHHRTYPTLGLQWYAHTMTIWARGQTANSACRDVWERSDFSSGNNFAVMIAIGSNTEKARTSQIAVLAAMAIAVPKISRDRLPKSVLNTAL